ncbi:WD repeat-containing protein 44 isoform X2 [Anopheles darlingi]|uniref:WD repeat-containing protein 44 isoform X2 n=1 Tax=Anopheles darlingi TaxID=43151 RepID=UPI00210061EB|nr:WD repeat-containing protein 44 isoform X2 [Anopheles darlingi]
MASGSESSDEFFDAVEDGSANATIYKSPMVESSFGNTDDNQVTQDNKSSSSQQATVKPVLVSHRNQRFRDLRQSMQNDDDENAGNILTPDSQTSSAEGVYIPASRSNYPFRVIESDVASIHSICSLGIVGRIMAGGSIDISGMWFDTIQFQTQIFQLFFYAHVGHSTGKDSSTSRALLNKPIIAPEPKIIDRTKDPDVISSTKQTKVVSKSNIFSSGTTMEPPVAPPRRKKKLRKQSSSSSDQFNLNEGHRLQAADSSSSEKLSLKRPTQPPPAPPTLDKAPGPVDGSSTISTSTDSTVASSSASGSEVAIGGPEALPMAGICSAGNSPVIPAVDGSDMQTWPATLESITREIENSFKESTAPTASPVMISSGNTPGLDTAAAGSAATSGSSSGSRLKLGQLASSFTHGTGVEGQSGLVTGSMNRLTHLVTSGREATHGGMASGGRDWSATTTISPSGSVKSNSAPARVSWIEGGVIGLNIYKATKGQFVVKPTDGAFNKAEGPSRDEIARVERMRKVGQPLEGAAVGAMGGGSGSRRTNLSATGTNSLESGTRGISPLAKQVYLKERRKSAGDEEMLKQLNMYVRTRTDSGKELTDLEILEQVPVKNLDTGENFPLSAVEEKLPQCINPLSLHIMRLTSHIPETDEESVAAQPDCDSIQPDDEEELESKGSERGRQKRKTARIKHFIRSTTRKTVSKARSIASELTHARHKEDVADIRDVSNPEQNIKIKASSTNKGPYDFAKLQHVQDLRGACKSAVWCMKFSCCGRLLATAGQDRMLRIWVLRDAYPFFADMRTKYNAVPKSSPTPSQESLNSSHNSTEEALALEAASGNSIGPFMSRSFCTYSGHTSDLLDVSWSKNYFILSSSMDKTVRLWHISRRECLCCFQHIDFVTAIAFHPRDDRYFLSGSLDGKLRLWNIPEKKVALWNEVDGQTKLITAANFCENGKFAVVGTYDGRCIFYNTDQLKYHTQIHVRSTRGRNAVGRKISGIEPKPGENKILVTSNDSRIRLYDLRDLNLSCKYKGYFNSSSQIKASFSQDGKYVVSGSENQCIYIWKTHHEYNKLSTVRRDRSDFWEGIKAHNATVTCAIFAPHPEAIIQLDPDETANLECPSPNTSSGSMSDKNGGRGYVLVSGDFNGSIKVFINKTKPKHSSLPYTAIAD